MSVCDLQGAMSVDSITDLDDNQSRLLEALQLSLPAEAQNKKEKARDKKLSLNPIYRQVPRLVDSCCQHLEKHGKQAHPPVSMYSSPSQLQCHSKLKCSLDQTLHHSRLCEDSWVFAWEITWLTKTLGSGGGGNLLDGIQTAQTPRVLKRDPGGPAI